jgi:RING finger protein 113A
MHDRGNYKTGWQMEKEFEEEQKKKGLAQELRMQGLLDDDEPDEDLDLQALLNVQFACPITRKPFIDPVVTQCGHYFEQRAAIKHYGKSSRCAVCNKPTYGVFNKGIKLLISLARREHKLKQVGKWPPPEFQDLDAASLPPSYLDYLPKRDDEGDKSGSDSDGDDGDDDGPVSKSQLFIALVLP